MQGDFSAVPAVLPSTSMPLTQPDTAQAEPPDSGVDTINVGNITHSSGIAIGRGAVVQVFQQVLLPAPSDYGYATLRMIEEHEEVFGWREAELAALDEFLERDDCPCLLLLAPTGHCSHLVAISAHSLNEWIDGLA
jgi:hypothetical protein